MTTFNISAATLSKVKTAGDHSTQASQEPLHLDSPPQEKCHIKGFLKTHALIFFTVAAIITGAGLGFALRSTNMTARHIKYFSFPGELLLRMLECVVLPIITSSIIKVLSSVKTKSYGKIGLWALCYYSITSVMAVLTGIVLVVIIQPGKSTRNASAPSRGEKDPALTVDAFLDLIRNMFPSNIVAACFRKYKTVYSKSLGAFNLTQTTTFDDQMPMPGTVDGANILGLIMLCIAYGLTLANMENEGKPLRDVFSCLNKATMPLISIVTWYSPVGLLFLVGGHILQLQNIGNIGCQLTMYIITVITGLVIHSFITLPLIYFTITRKNPFSFMAGILQALTVAFGTSSSTVTIPIAIRCLERNLNMDQQVTRVILPIVATLTMDGIALYEPVAAIFIAQVHNMDLDAAQIIIISFISTAAAIGATDVPQGGMIAMVLVLTSAGLPIKGITFIFAVDWMLDRFRKFTNMLGDCIGVAVLQHLCRNELQTSRPIEECLVEENRVTSSN